MCSFTIGTNCGLRISDIVALNVEDVRNKTHIQITEQKTGKFKKFPINSKFKPMIEEFTKNKKPNEPLFTTIFKNRMDRSLLIFNHSSPEVTLRYIGIDQDMIDESFYNFIL